VRHPQGSASARKAPIRLAVVFMQVKSRKVVTEGIGKYLMRATVGKKRNADSKLDPGSYAQGYHHHTWVHTTEATGIQ
jgi:hypothetical protein